jgi:hypothetical protein
VLGAGLFTALRRESSYLVGPEESCFVPAIRYCAGCRPGRYGQSVALPPSSAAARAGPSPPGTAP